jgi:hypothetical protein
MTIGSRGCLRLHQIVSDFANNTSLPVGRLSSYEPTFQHLHGHRQGLCYEYRYARWCIFSHFLISYPNICWLRSKAILENMTLLEVQEYFLGVLGCKMIVNVIGRLVVGKSLPDQDSNLNTLASYTANLIKSRNAKAFG